MQFMTTNATEWKYFIGGTTLGALTTLLSEWIHKRRWYQDDDDDDTNSDFDFDFDADRERREARALYSMHQLSACVCGSITTVSLSLLRKWQAVYVHHDPAPISFGYLIAKSSHILALKVAACTCIGLASMNLFSQSNGDGMLLGGDVTIAHRASIALLGAALFAASSALEPNWSVFLSDDAELSSMAFAEVQCYRHAMAAALLSSSAAAGALDGVRAESRVFDALGNTLFPSDAQPWTLLRSIVWPAFAAFARRERAALDASGPLLLGGSAASTADGALVSSVADLPAPFASLARSVVAVGSASRARTHLSSAATHWHRFAAQFADALDLTRPLAYAPAACALTAGIAIGTLLSYTVVNPLLLVRETTSSPRSRSREFVNRSQSSIAFLCTQFLSYFFV
jgi:hypothetical protein